MKKLLLLFVMMLPLLANAYDFQADGIFYTILSETEHTVEVAYDGSGSSHYSGDLIIPEQVTKYDQTYTVIGIGNQAFMDCEKLYSITIPKTVSYIHSLSSASAFKKFNVDADSPYFVSIDGVLVSKDGDLINYPAGKSDTEYIIPDGVTTINSGAFTHCNNLRIVKMSNNVKTINDGGAFYYGAIEEIILSESLEYIGEQSFMHLAIENITLPHSLKHIGNDAFNGCDKLKSIYIPENVEYIGDENEAIGFCDGLETIEVDPQNQYYKSIDGVLYNKDVTKLMRCPSRNPNAEWFEIPETVTELSRCAFHTVTTLTRLVIPSGITAIPEGAFMYCRNLSRVTCYAKTPPSTPIPHFSIPDPWNYSGRENATLYVPKGTRSAYLSYYCSQNGGWTYSPYAKFKEIVEMEDEPVSEYTDEQGVIYSLNTDGKSYSVTDHTDSCVGDVAIPESWEGLSVTSIGEMAFQYCNGLTSVTIPSSVTSIGHRAFDRCDGLTSLSVEDGNTKFDSRDNCNAIIETETNTLIRGSKNTTIPSSVTSIGFAAFSGYSDLTSVAIPNSVTSIGEGAFFGCSGLTSITIPNSVTSIGNNAFDSCTGLTSVTIPNSVTSIGIWAFDCSNLTSVTVKSKTPRGINDITFPYRADATLYVPAGSKAAYQAADYWNEFNEIIEFEPVPTGIEVIDGIYYNLNEDNIAEVTRIPDNSPKYSGAIAIPATVTYGNFEYNVTSIGSYAFDGCSGLTSITIPNSVISIDDRAFDGCSGLTSITIPNSVTYIGNGAFVDCSSLTSITIPNSVTSIGSYVFEDCSGLTSITIPNSVTSIGDNAFRNCSGLTSITIPTSVTSIGSRVFAGCSGLSSLNVEVGNTEYDSRENCNAIIKTATNTLIYGTKNTTIPTSVTSIGNDAFFNCSGLTSITIPNSVTSIGSQAFYKCSGLTSITIPNSVTSIGIEVFSGCSGLTSITIPNSVTSIGNEAFYKCSGLTSITIPNSVTSIGNEAFDYCSGLTSIIIPNSVTFIGNNAFGGCSGLTSITIPNSVTSIGNKMFKKCSGLTSITIPNSVTSIGKEAFSGCSSLTSVIVEINTPLSIIESVFPERANATLYVPEGSKAAYQAADYWKEFKEIKEMVEPKVKLNKTTAAIEKGKTLTLKATFTPSDFSDKSVIWKSSDTKVATVSSSGKVTGVKAGTATITCTSKATGTKATCKVTIGYVGLNKTEAYLEKDKSLTLKATVYPTSLKDKTVTWKSSDTKVATVTSAGKVNGVKAGTATITCTSKATGLKATCVVTVGYVKLNETKVTLEKGNTVTLKATVYPSSLKDKTVTWKSSDKTIATVTSSGKVKGMKAGTATITCTSKATGLKETCTVTIGYVKLDKTKTTLEKGNTVTLKATVYPSSLKDKSVTWKSSDTKVASVSSSGKVKAVKAGTATITCTSKATGLKETCTVTVVNGTVTLNKTEVRIQKGKTVTLKATVTPTSLKDKSVTWKSSNTKIATVTSSGKVKGIKAGTATITCTSKATGVKATCTVTVLQTMGSLTKDGDEIEMVTDINEIEEPAVIEPFDVYDLSGRKVLHQVTSLDGLPRGIYIVNGKKILKK